VKVDAVTDWGAPVHVEMSQERFQDLRLAKNEPVFITPKAIAVFQKDRAS
jgi:hypothetical protein